jgi:hypothetical protein
MSLANDTGRFVYFVQGGDFIKIGLSGPKNFGKRLQEISTGCPFKVSLLGVTDGDIAIEQGLHRKFRSCHHHGEWFYATPKLLAYIAKVVRAREASDLRIFHSAFSKAVCRANCHAQNVTGGQI